MQPWMAAEIRYHDADLDAVLVEEPVNFTDSLYPVAETCANIIALTRNIAPMWNVERCRIFASRMDYINGRNGVDITPAVVEAWQRVYASRRDRFCTCPTCS